MRTPILIPRERTRQGPTDLFRNFQPCMHDLPHARTNHRLRCRALGRPARTPGHSSSAAIWTETHAFRPTRPESGIDHRVRDHGDHRWADLLGDSTRLAVDRPVGGDSRCSATGRRRRCTGRRTDPVVVIDARPGSHVRRGQRDRRSAQPGQPWVCPADAVTGTRLGRRATAAAAVRRRTADRRRSRTHRRHRARQHHDRRCGGRPVGVGHPQAARWGGRSGAEPRYERT